MTLWPPDWTFVVCLVAFAAASLAVQSWRQLSVLIAVTTALVVPVKWLGAAAGFAMFAEPAFIAETLANGMRYRAEPSAALLASIIIGSLLMIAVKEVKARRDERAAD